MQTSEPTVLTQDSMVTSELAIAQLTEPVVEQYFETLNASAFADTAALFAEDGALHPPFESAIVGPEAIAEYLEKEAKGMKLQPKEAIAEPLEDGNTQVTVRGKVQTQLFGVNVAWTFTLNPQHQLQSATVKLLASPQELLNLRR